MVFVGSSHRWMDGTKLFVIFLKGGLFMWSWVDLVCRVRSSETLMFCCDGAWW